MLEDERARFDEDQTSYSQDVDTALPKGSDAFANLLILGGYHSGNAVPLDGGGILEIGSGDDDDVILSDPGVRPTHIKIRIFKSGRSFEVEAVGGAVELDDGRLLEPGEMASLALPGRIAMVAEGDARVGLFLDVNGVARDSRGRRAVASRIDESAGSVWSQRFRGAVGAFFAVALVVGVSVAVGDTKNSNKADASEGIPKQIVQSRLFVPDDPEVMPRKSIETSAASLRQKLDSVGLSNLTVSATEDFVSVKGTLLPRKENAWNSVRRWYDREHASDFTLVVDITAQSEDHPLPKRPIGIWLGDEPYVVDADGQRKGIGARTSDGWEILSIDRTGVRLRRDGQELSLSF